MMDKTNSCLPDYRTLGRGRLHMLFLYSLSCNIAFSPAFFLALDNETTRTQT